MTLIQWDASFSVGVAEIDAQHKGLIDMINELHDAAPDADRSIIVSDIVLRLKNYFNEHFSTEERFMLNHDYPQFMDHKAEHIDFVKKILDFEMACLESYAPYTATLDYLKTWLAQHVMGTDQKLGAYLREKVLP